MSSSSCPKFCPNCCNYLYLQTNHDEPTKLENVCHNCGFADKCVGFFETSATQKEIDTTDLIYDLTFMRTRAIKCPDGCDSEVLYLKKKTQEQNLLFVCCKCSKQFKNKAAAAAAAAAATDDSDDDAMDEDDDAMDEDDDDDDDDDDDGDDDMDEETTTADLDIEDEDLEEY